MVSNTLDNSIHKLINGDQSALEELFNYYYPRLYNFSKSFLKIEEGIDDILQEVFIKIWQNRESIKKPDTFNSYIFTITKNLLLNELRRKLSDSKTKSEIQNRSLAEEYHQFEQIEFKELKEKLDFEIENLPEKQKEIFILSRKEGLSHKEIAEKLKISTKTVEYHIRQSINILKNKISDFGIIAILYLYLFL